MKRALTNLGFLLICLWLAACSSTSKKAESPGPDEPDARVELDWAMMGSTDPAGDGRLVRLSDEDLTERGAQIVPDAAAELLPAFLREVETRFSARWTGEGPIFGSREGQRRRIRLRRILEFDDEQEALEIFPDCPDMDLVRGEKGRIDVISLEMSFVVIASGDRGAMRVELERLFVRRASPELKRMLPLSQPVPVIMSFSLKYVHENDEIARTIVFAETVDVTESDYDGGGTVSDWIAVESGPRPHSIVVGAAAREELKGVTKVMREAGLSILGLAGSVRRAGLF